MIPRPRDLTRFLLGLLFLVPSALALLLGAVNGAEVTLMWTVSGGVQVIVSFFVNPRRRSGPGPLDPTPAGRFRATGWPPSKDPEEYR